MKNKLIVIEGTDGCGKKTQSGLLFERMKESGENCILLSFPNYLSPACAPVKMYLNGDFGAVNCLTAYQANALYAVDRLCTMQQYKSHILNGGAIVFDRYVESTMLHQACLIEDLKERDKFLDYVDNFEFGVLDLPRPDLVIFLDLPVEISKKLANERDTLKTGNKRDIHEESVDHLQKAYESGKYVAQKYGWSVINCVKNNKMMSIEEISDLIWAEVIKREND